MNKIIALLIALTLVFTLAACSGEQVASTNAVSPSQSMNGSGNKSVTAITVKQNSDTSNNTIAVVYDNEDEDSSWNSSETSYIALKGNSIILEGDGAVVDGSKVAITSAGTYSISGTLDDGQVIVNTKDKEIVRLILNGANITSSSSAPIYIMKAKKAVIILADGTGNYVTDGDSYTLEDPELNEPNAAIFSKCDLTINGSGSLTVDANYNNGITSKDELRITGGTITVNAVNDGIRGRDFIAIKGGNITVNAESDGMQSNNDEDSEKGFVAIEGGAINITAGKDGIQAETSALISGGNITISSGGGSTNNTKVRNTWGNRGMENISDTSSSTSSAKGIKAVTDVAVNGGTITIDSSDDSLHSNDSLMINGGTIILTSGDDGIHADSTVEINGGDITITKSYEGIESTAITINDGIIHLVSSDDGFNATSGGDDFPMGGPMGGQMGRLPNVPSGQGDLSSSATNYLSINGGYIVIDAMGDGLDINGTITMTGGIVIINGPTANDNGALDHVAFKMTGGFLVAVGSSGMAQAPGTSSTQYSVMLNLTSSQPANTLFHIETKDGADILTFKPTKAYQSVVLCSPELKNGASYVVYSGGSSTGKVTDGLYSGGTYTAGTQNISFTISSLVTTIGSSTRGFPGGAGGGFPGGGGR